MLVNTSCCQNQKGSKYQKNAGKCKKRQTNLFWVKIISRIEKEVSKKCGFIYEGSGLAAEECIAEGCKYRRVNIQLL